ncbi:HEAT repeat domain-containing protein [Paludisphaera sp.]|uniref:HEAT repeat domain-containing protein n=1 Tax=Paludisphaera sp. TaxID=2017432 RepID=UPI00301E00AF
MPHHRVRSIDRCGDSSGARRRAVAVGVLAALGLAWPAAAPPALAQAPGPDLFAVEPRSPEQLWEAVDYLSRTGQGRQAVPYIEAFNKLEVDDAELLKLRDRFGPGSFLRLADDPATRPYAAPLADRLVAAARRLQADPERIKSYIPGLLASREERDYAVDRLRESGSFAVPAIVAEMGKYNATDPRRERLVDAAGRLDTSSTPAWIAALDSPDPMIAADAARILGDLGDPRAIPFLTYPAASPDSPPPVKAAATLAIERLTGRPFAQQPKSPVQTLSDAADAFVRRQYEMPSEQVLLWRWDPARNAPAPTLAKRVDVEGIFGGAFAEQALRLAPGDRRAQVVSLGFKLSRAVDKVGYENFPGDDLETYGEALAAGPGVLGDLVREAIATGRPTLAAAAARALGRVADPALAAEGGRQHPLVEALSAPGRRLQLAAAKAIVDLAPPRPFPGSSRVVPTLARFLLSGESPRAVIVDGNPGRASQMAGSLRAMGYQVQAEPTGEAAFAAAVESADVELILAAHDQAGGSWDVQDVLSMFRGDARVASLPLFIYGPRDLEYRRPNLPANYPGVKFIVHTDDPEALERQIGRPSLLSGEERASQARRAAEALARIADSPRSLFVPDLAGVDELLVGAIGLRDVQGPVAATLAEIPSPRAQRALADAILDASRDPELRRDGARLLARSLQRFGPMLAPDQEAKLADAYASEGDVELRAGLGAALGALRRASRDADRPAPR